MLRSVILQPLHVMKADVARSHHDLFSEGFLVCDAV